ncbi:MAG: formate dehydrogenase accessory sulfurtransferase FdhD [Gammaproteobacteria bacterium]|nr:formate dehydrogenase accessory sulfurtransferase FdhD [Gammaproteobacteria bacterium]MDH3363836.1 formate dehydrogenase accessory sulfurtransferase FdhD [Gammaproteobacteria bacterium]MDH3482357.1 formate dehydrogenase accessory sulfurtransferase FdhD [Gammaproteobacteria bacterium]
MPGNSAPITVIEVLGNSRRSRDDRVAVEEPLEIRLGYETPAGRSETSISITMRTPGNDEELATGFLYSESIIRGLSDIALVKPCGPPAPDSGYHNVTRVELEPDVRFDLDRLQRHFYTTSSCGVCGKTSLDALRVSGASKRPFDDTTFSRKMLTSLSDKLRAAQKTFEETGGLHAAAAFGSNGDLLVTHEDVGRHNAVDKVIGTLLSRKLLPANELGLMVSGRASFELMQKALMAGMPILAAVGAPSSLAVDLAREFNITLVGFLSGDRFNIYTAEERVV